MPCFILNVKTTYGKASNARSLLEMSLEFSLFVLEPLVLDLGILQLLGHREGGLVQEQELAAVAPVAQASAVAGNQTQVVLKDKISCNSDRQSFLPLKLRCTA